MSKEITIYHNPNCSTSRKTLAAIEAAGLRPTVVEYLKTGWTREQLTALFARMGVRPRAALRLRGATPETQALADPSVPDDTVIAAMIADPVLVERPIVVSARGAAICRPVETVERLLP